MTYENTHVAIIMDGNGRWARRRGLPRTAGHRAGAKTVRVIVETAARLDIGALTLYAFSSDNWSRPPHEVRNLMTLLKRYLLSETRRCRKHGIRLAVIGRRDRLAPDLLRAVEEAELRTRDGAGMLLRLAVDYSASHAIVTAARNYASRLHTDADFARALCATMHSPAHLQSVDLLIRTGGEQRLSDFLLWECAYAELVFTATHWPDFDARDLRAALSQFAQRERRFGGVDAPRVSRRAG